MYKIYINGNPLVITKGPVSPKSDALIAPYPGKIKFLHHYIDLLEKTESKRTVYLLCPNPGSLFSDFASLYKVVEAAGGLVTNPAGEVLFLYRRGFWDLPKGKIDAGEQNAEAAVREVEEETGVQDLLLGDFLLTTYHTYKTAKGKRILKPTYWYQMTAPDQPLTPQVEEDIELAVWKAPAGLLETNPPIYENIVDVLSA